MAALGGRYSQTLAWIELLVGVWAEEANTEDNLVGFWIAPNDSQGANPTPLDMGEIIAAYSSYDLQAARVFFNCFHDALGLWVHVYDYWSANDWLAMRGEDSDEAEMTGLPEPPDSLPRRVDVPPALQPGEPIPVRSFPTIIARIGDPILRRGLQDAVALYRRAWDARPPCMSGNPALDDFDAQAVPAVLLRWRPDDQVTAVYHDHAAMDFDWGQNRAPSQFIPFNTVHPGSIRRALRQLTTGLDVLAEAFPLHQRVLTYVQSFS